MYIMKLRDLVLKNEDRLIDLILEYGKTHGYNRYTATSKEAWRLSVSGLSNGMIAVIDGRADMHELRPDEEYTNNDVSRFGILEARKHCSRGITMEMFLGFMKYYHQAYLDIIYESDLTIDEKFFCCNYVKRYFDNVELGFVTEWMGLTESEKMKNLAKTNRDITNEKNKYISIFESIYDPVILTDRNNDIDNINMQAAKVFMAVEDPEKKKFSADALNHELNWLREDLDYFVSQGRDEILAEKTIMTRNGERTYLIKFRKMLDFSEKYRGAVVIFNDITERLKSERRLMEQQQKLEYYASTDSLTGVMNRRIGLMTLEKEMAFFRSKKLPLSVCYIDIDGLKNINDHYGHIEGDSAINVIISVFRETIRDVDLICRMGGDEFMVLFPNCTAETVEKIIRRVVGTLEEHDAESTNEYCHSFSWGTLEISRDNDMDVNGVVEAADKKMYEHKLRKKRLSEIDSL